MNLFYAAYALITGKNHANAPVAMIQEQLTEKRPLPVGLSEFHEWSDRIISGAGLPAAIESQKYTLANDLLTAPPTMAYEADVYFIHRLRKFAVNQVADAYRKELYAKKQARFEQEMKAKQNQAEVTPLESADGGKVLEIKRS